MKEHRTIIKVLCVCILSILLHSYPAKGGVGFAVDFAGGTGDPNDPYQIATTEQLTSIGSDPNLLNKHFVLVNDIDLDPNLPGGQVFTHAVIAPDIDTTEVSQVPEFTGSFNGNGHRIKNLIIHGDTANYLALFGKIGVDGLVLNLRLENISVLANRSRYLGTLVGCIQQGEIINCYVTGKVSGENNTGVFGGLVGWNIGSITNCHASVNVTGHDKIGGLVGLNGEIIIEPGGLQVVMEGKITGCWSNGHVSGGGTSEALGGLVGANSKYSEIHDCHATGDVTGGKMLGGLVGYNHRGWIENCQATGNVSGGDDANDIGGLVGLSKGGTILNSYSTSQVTGSNRLGGLVGYSDSGWIESCHATGNVSGGDDANDIGGLVGLSEYAYILNSHANGDVTGGIGIGGLVGRNSGGTIISCHASGEINGGNKLGGLVGYNGYRYDYGSVDSCYATGIVSGRDNSSELGGLVGLNEGRIANCFALSNVSGRKESRYLGGLAGCNRGSITNCYSAGSVSGGDNSMFLGGLVGKNKVDLPNGRWNKIISCYFLSPTDGGGPDKGVGLTLTDKQMKQQASFVDWDFERFWTIREGEHYPMLQPYRRLARR